MPIQKKNAFSRRLPDLVTEELVSVLSQKSSFEFKQLFEIVHENSARPQCEMRERGARKCCACEPMRNSKNLVQRGMAKKTGKKYKGVASALAAAAASTAAAARVSATAAPAGVN